MVAYGKSLKKSRRVGWEAAYLDYKDLKRIIHEIEVCADVASAVTTTTSTTTTDNAVPRRRQQQHDDDDERTRLTTTASHNDIEQSTSPTIQTAADTNNNNMEDVMGRRWKTKFFQQLAYEIEKLSLFTLQRLGDLADTIGTLRFEDTPSVANLFHREQHVLQTPSSSFHGGNNDNSDNGNDTKLEKSKQDDQLETYLKLGVELLHIMQFVALNSVGIRKILKKYNKTVQHLGDDPKHHYYYYHFIGSSRDHVHLQSVANSQSVAALQSSFQRALVQYYSNDQSQLLLLQGQQSTLSSSSFATMSYRILLYYRFQTIMQASYMIQDTLMIVNQPFREYLGRKALIRTGTNLGDMEGTLSIRSMEQLMSFNPDDLLVFDEDRLRSLWNSWIPDYDELVENCNVILPTIMNVEGGFTKQQQQQQPSIDPYLLKCIDVAMEILLEEEDRNDIGGTGGGAQLTSRKELTEREKMWGGADGPSMALNLMSILLYTINYYIVSPTANHYATILGTDGAFGATLIGASSFSAIFAAFVYSFWYTKSSIKSALVFSTLCPLVGNLIYSLAISYDSMTMAIGGRILCGFGSAEVVNRQMISSCVSFKHMTRASAYFVAFGAMGMSIGPLIAAVLDDTAGRDLNIDLNLPFTPAKGIIYNHVTSPGFFMACLWFVELVSLVYFFKEPDRVNGSAISESLDGDEELLHEDEYGSFTENQRLSIAESSDGSTLRSSIFSISSSSGGFWNEIQTTWKLVTMNPGLPVTLLLFCYVELADEIIISSCSMVVRRYFSWHGSAAGFLIAALGALVLPANYVVETFSHRVSERRILMWSIWFIIAGLFGILNYQGMYYDLRGLSQYGGFDPDGTVNIQELQIGGEQVGSILTKEKEFPYDFGHGIPVYMTFLSIIFMGTIVLEGVDTSIMAQVSPAALNDRFINSGLMATLIGTLGRVLSDALITLSALLDLHLFVDFVNATFIPLLIFTLACLIIARSYYHCLV